MSNYQHQPSPLEISMGLTPFDAARLKTGFTWAHLAAQWSLYLSIGNPAINQPGNQALKRWAAISARHAWQCGSAGLTGDPHWGTRPSSPVSAQLRRRAEPRILKGNDDAI